MAQGRVQAPDIPGAVPLHSPGVPSDTYAQPARPPVDNNLAQLADALGHFNTNLQGFGIAAARANAGAEQDADTVAVNEFIGSRSREDVVKAIESGEAPQLRTKIQQDALATYYGQSKANATIAQIEANIQSGKIRMTGDDPMQAPQSVDGFIRGQAQQDLQNLPDLFRRNGPAFKAYRTAIDSYSDRMVKAQQEALASQLNAYRDGIVTQNFNKVFDAPLSPQTTQDTIRQVYKELGVTMNRSPAQLDDLLSKVIKDRVSNPDTAEKALHVWTADRIDPATGQSVGTLASKPAFAQVSHDILTAATNTLGTKYVNDTKKLAEINAYQSLVNKDGNFSNMTDVTVPNRVNPSAGAFTVKAEEAKKAAVTSFLTNSAAEQQATGESDDARFEREWGVMTTNNVVHPGWKDQLTDGAKGLLSPSAITDPTTRDRAISAGELYMKGAERNYPYMKAMIGSDKDTLNSWEMYRTLRTALDYSPQKAVSAVSIAMRTPDNENDLHVREQNAKDIATKVAGYDFGSGMKYYIPFFNDTAANVSEVQRRVGDIASYLVRVPGIGSDKAIQYAMQAVADHSMIINGNVVTDINGGVAQQHKPYIEQFLQKAYDQHAKDWGTDGVSNLTVKPMGGGNYQIIDKTDGFGHPVEVPSGNGSQPAVITNKMIQDAIKRDAGVAAEQNRVDSARARDAAILRTGNEFLTPDALKRKAELLEQSKQDFNNSMLRRVDDYSRVNPMGTPDVNGEAMKLMADGVKHFGASVYDTLQKLGASINHHTSKAGERLIAPGL